MHADEMYFICEGRVNYVYGDKLYCFKTMVDGSYFGEIEILGSQSRAFTSITDTKCELLVMPAEILLSLREEYPKIFTQLEVTAEKRRVRNL
jgi:CRP-like cAMP-binding protein